MRARNKLSSLFTSGQRLHRYSESTVYLSGVAALLAPLLHLLTALRPTTHDVRLLGQLKLLNCAATVRTTTPKGLRSVLVCRHVRLELRLGFSSSFARLARVARVHVAKSGHHLTGAHKLGMLGPSLRWSVDSC